MFVFFNRFLVFAFDYLGWLKISNNSLVLGSKYQRFLHHQSKEWSVKFVVSKWIMAVVIAIVVLGVVLVVVRVKPLVVLVLLLLLLVETSLLFFLKLLTESVCLFVSTSGSTLYWVYLNVLIQTTALWLHSLGFGEPRVSGTPHRGQAGQVTTHMTDQQFHVFKNPVTRKWDSRLGHNCPGIVCKR